jgi:hypothetical protein
MLVLSILVGWDTGHHLPSIPWNIPLPIPIPTPFPPTPSAFRAILAYDSSKPLSRGQSNVLNSTAVRGYLNAKCLKDSDGRPAWRQWDVNVDVSNESSTWKDAWQEVKAKLGALPQIAVQRGDKLDVLPLPDTEAATLDLLKKYGGN